MLQSSASTIRYPLLSLREQKGDGDIPDFPEYNISFYSTSNGLKNLLLSKIMAKSKCLPLPHICHNLEWPSAKGCSCGIQRLGTIKQILLVTEFQGTQQRIRIRAILK